MTKENNQSKDELLKPKEEPRKETKEGEKPKRSGTLDWSKAKVKNPADKAAKEKEVKTAPKPKAEPKPKLKSDPEPKGESQPKSQTDGELSTTEESQRDNSRGIHADGSLRIGPPKVCLVFKLYSWVDGSDVAII